MEQIETKKVAKIECLFQTVIWKLLGSDVRRCDGERGVEAQRGQRHGSTAIT